MNNLLYGRAIVQNTAAECLGCQDTGAEVNLKGATCAWPSCVKRTLRTLNE